MEKIEFKEIYKSDLKAVKQVEPLLSRIKDKIEIKKDKYYNIVVAVTEAVNNAVMHGNRCDPEKRVLISFTAMQDELTVVIEDQGKGFDPDCLEDPRLPENLLKPSGRGVFLMERLSDDMELKSTKKGTKAVLKFNL